MRTPPVVSLAVLFVALLLWAAPPPATASAPADDGDDPRTAVSPDSTTLSDSTTADEPAPAGDETTDNEAVSDGEPELDLAIGGAVRFNLLFEDFDETNRQKTGEFTFDTFRVNADGTYGDLFFSAEYRFYTGYRFLHSGYAGYNISDNLNAQLGVHQVPFGIQPYFSNSWFFNLSYYAGFEDDYDAGLKVEYTPGNWTLVGAYYMNAEQTSFSGGTSFARYSFDVVPATTDDLGYAGLEANRDNQEIDQFNAKVGYTLNHGAEHSTRLVLSGQTGTLYNRVTTDTERNWAGSVDLNGQYGRFNVKLGVMQYAYTPPNVEGDAKDFIVMAAYNAPYKVASEARFYSAGIAYDLPVDLGPISSFRFYNDLSYHDKAPDAYVDGTSNITGVLTTAGPLFVYTDFLVTKNHPFSIPAANFGTALAEGTDAWNVGFNLNIGLYF